MRLYLCRGPICQPEVPHAGQLRPYRFISGVGRESVACAVSGSCQATALRNSACASSNSSCHGQADAMAVLIRLVAEILPPDKVLHVPGNTPKPRPKNQHFWRAIHV